MPLAAVLRFRPLVSPNVEVLNRWLQVCPAPLKLFCPKCIFLGRKFLIKSDPQSDVGVELFEMGDEAQTKQAGFLNLHLKSQGASVSFNPSAACGGG